jgi:NAD(P)-dependent dehydrogenase (short-subunit alcohol dehydrogenase family)/pimeloyl-ACP methyl ester carboxylesterase
MSELRVRSGDVELGVRTWGNKEAPAIVLVHGYPDTSAVWDPVAERLGNSFHVVAYDVRGAGTSTAPARDREYALDHLVDDLAAVIDATCTGPVHLVGHDWGSIQSWEAVTADEGFGGRLRSFTSISGPCLDHVGYWLREQPRSTLAAQAVKSTYIAALHAPGVKYAWRALGGMWSRAFERVEGVAATAGDRRRDGAQGVGLYRANIAPRLARPRIRTTELPIHIVVPTRDHYVDPRMTLGIERWAPQAWRREVDAGHWEVLADADRLARWLTEWVDAIEHGRTAPGLRRARSGGRIANKLAVVTGAGSGIGRATTIELVARGARVIAVDLDLDAAKTTAELAQLVAWDGERAAVTPRRLDVADPVGFAELAAWLRDTERCPDIVINNAGIGVAGGLLATSAAEWERLFAVNLGGVVHGCRTFARQMVDERRPGHIINVASAAAFAPSKDLVAYSTSKAAVLMLTECLRAELADAGISVGAICPGFVDTPITTSTRYAGQDAAREAARRRTATRMYRRRGLTAETVAREICAAIETDRPLTTVGVEATALRWISRLSPSLQRMLATIELSPRGAR